MSDVAALTTDNFETTVGEGITLVDFWAEWCGPCKMIGPLIDEIAGEYEGKAKVAKVDIDDQPDLAARFNVSSIPTLLVLKNGEEAKRFVGVTPKAALCEALDDATG